MLSWLLLVPRQLLSFAVKNFIFYKYFSERCSLLLLKSSKDRVL
jgi:hypothetical protein